MKKTLAGFSVVLLFFSTFTIFAPRVKSEFTHWTTRTPLPQPIACPGVVAANDKVYAIGGQCWYDVWLNTNCEYSPVTDNWISKAPMPTPRTDLACVSVNNRIYAIGGAASEGGFLSTNEEFDPATNSWSIEASMPTPRELISAAAVNDAIYVIGGVYGGYGSSANEMYNTSTNTWTTKAQCPLPCCACGIGVVNGKIYLIGGVGQAQQNEEYDPQTNTWTPKASMPTARSGLSVVVVNSKIYAIGGSAGDSPWGNPLNVVEEYDPSTDTWNTVQSMPTPRSMLGAAAVDNTIYALGGVQENLSRYLDTNEGFDTQPLVTFTESGLPPGDTWSVMLNGDKSSPTSGNTITFNEPIGSYSFEIESTVDFGSTHLLLSPIREGDIGTINVGGDTVVNIEWLDYTQICELTIYPVGLPTGASWSATYGCLGQTVPSASDITFFRFSKGTYHFSASSPGYATEPQSFDVIADPAVNLGPCAGVIFFKDSNPRNFLSWDPERDCYSVANMGTQWQTDGNCYGFSATAVIYYMHYTLGYDTYPYFPLQDPQATSTSDLKMGSDPYSTLNNPTLAIMFHELYDPQDNVPGKGLVCEDETQQFSFLQQNLSKGLPVVLNIWDYSQNLHSVVAWGDVELENGNYAIAIYDPDFPQSTQAATYNPTTRDFLYSTGNLYENFIVVSPGIVSTSWNVARLPGQAYFWVNPSYTFYATNYYIVIANKMVTLDNNGWTDCFSAVGDSQTFVKGIYGSSGIEEGNMQVYAIPYYSPFTISDPGSNQSTIQITHANNGSGQPEVYTWLLNASTTDGSLNFTATPSSAGLSIVAGDSPLNATVTCFSATQQGYSVSDVLTAQIDAGQNVNLTAPCAAGFTLSKIVVGKGYPVPMNVTINNVGLNPENVSLTLCANTTTLDSEMVSNLLNGTSVNFVCSGNTSSCAYGNYTLSAYCEPDGINEAGVNFTYVGVVEVTIPGDVDGNFKVNMGDLSALCDGFGSTIGANGNYWHKPPGILDPFSPNLDIDGNGKIDMGDIVTALGNFGQHYP